MRIRTIKPEFWKSQTIAELSDSAKLLALGLLNYADDEGYFFAHPALIRGELMPFAASHEHIPALLQELQKIEFIRLGEDASKRKIGMVVHFRKHQLVNRPQRSKLAGTVEFPNWSPALAGTITEDSVNTHGTITEDSVNTHGTITAGMDQGSGKGSGNGSGNGSGRGSGEPSPGKPGGTSAESSIPEPDPGAPSSDAAASKIPPGAKKKKGAAAAPEFPEGVGADYQHALGLWWHYKRERREGYKASGWAALLRQQLRFPPEQVLASVEASMAANWAGLFTEKCGGAVEPGRGGQQSSSITGTIGMREAPKGWRTAMAVLFGDDWDTHYPAFQTMPPADQRQVRVWLEKSGPQAFECPPPPDWREHWAAIFGDMPRPETWDEVCKTARQAIVETIELKGTAK
jgi:hypothetical protein